MATLLESLPRYILFPSVEEENNLVMKARAGDHSATMQLIKYAGPIIHRMIRQSKVSEEQKEDLATCIVMNVMKAILKFNFDKNTRFVNYATFWIRNAKIEFKESTRMMKFPLTRGSSTLYRALNELRGMRNKHPEINFNVHLREAAISNKVKEEELFAYLSQSFGTVVDDSKEEGGIIESLVDSSLSPEDLTNSKQSVDILKEAISCLNDREKTIIELRYLKDDQSLEEIGNRFNITRERVRQLESRALQSLKSKIRELTNSGEIL